MKQVARGEADYEELRRAGVWQEFKPDRYPDRIVRPDNPEEVVRIVRDLVSEGQWIAVKGSGHNYTSTYLRNGGVQLDLSGLDEIEIQGDIAKVGPGARSADVSRALVAAGRGFPTGHHAGVALGGFLLGGGMGWNGEHWGQFACFNVEALDVVLATGEATTIAPDNHPDLYWAARGAGPLFPAVVTRFYLRTVQAPTALCGMRATWSLDATPALSAWLEAESGRPHEDLELILMFEMDPLNGQRHAVVLVLYHGSDAAYGQRIIKEVFSRSPEGGEGSSDPFPLTYELLYSQSLTGEAQRTGADTIWTDQPARASNIMANFFASAPSTGSVGIVNFRGEADRLPEAACSMIGRGFLQWLGQWTGAENDAENFAWVEDLAVALEPVTKGCYVNETDILRRPDRLPKCFSEEAWTRLHRVRDHYDPDGRFPAPVPDPR